MKCVLVATRPLLLSVLKERLEKLDQGEEDWQSFLALTKPLMSTGIKSAIKTLQVLSSEDGLLGESTLDDLNIVRKLIYKLELFLPFDLEFTYGAAIHLALANTLFPQLEGCPTYNHVAYSILDEMVCKGNRVAEMRKSELAHLQTLFDELATRAEWRALQTLALSAPPETDSQLQDTICEDGQDGGYLPQAEPTAVLTPGDIQTSSAHLHLGMVNNDFLGNLGISSNEFISIVDQMGEPDSYYHSIDVER